MDQPDLPSPAPRIGDSRPPHRGPGERILSELGDDARQRPAPTVHDALAGTGGALTAGGLIALTAEGGERIALVLVGALVVAASAWIRLARDGGLARQLRCAAVGAGAAGIGASALGIAGPEADEIAPVLLLCAAGYLGAWVAPGFRGRPLFLGLGAFALVYGLAALDGDWWSGGDVFDVLGNGAAPLHLVGAGILFAIVYGLDQGGYHGMAAPLAAVGLLASITGTLLVAGDLGDIGGPMLAMAVGAVLAAVGTAGGRRASIWTGVALLAGGLVALAVNAADAAEGTAAAAVVMVVGVALAGASLVRREPGSPPPANWEPPAAP